MTKIHGMAVLSFRSPAWTKPDHEYLGGIARHSDAPIMHVLYAQVSKASPDYYPKLGLGWWSLDAEDFSNKNVGSFLPAVGFVWLFRFVPRRIPGTISPKPDSLGGAGVQGKAKVLAPHASAGVRICIACFGIGATDSSDSPGSRFGDTHEAHARVDGLL